MTLKCAMNGQTPKPKLWGSKKYRADVEFWLIIRTLQLVVFFMGFMFALSVASKGTSDPMQVFRAANNVIAMVNNLALSGGNATDKVDIKTLPQDVQLSFTGSGKKLIMCVIKGAKTSCEEHEYSVEIQGEVTITGAGWVGAMVTNEGGTRKVIIAKGQATQ